MTPKRAFPLHIVVFLAPAVLIYSLFMIYPLLDSLRLSFYQPAQPIVTAGVEGAADTITTQARVDARAAPDVFVGLANYQRLFTDPNYAPRLAGAVKNNFVFFSIHLLVQNPIALLLATLLTSHLTRLKGLFRTLLFTPTILSFVLVGFIWQIILNPLWGISGDILKLVGLGDLNQPWLGLETTALPTLGLISVWQFIGIPMMLFIAALINVPEEIVEAATVDGASAWQTFWKVKFPLILPTVGIVGILTFVGNFNAFDLIYTVQGGLAGPNFATDILGTFFYRTFFGFQLQQGNPALGATIAGIMFLIILAGVAFYLVVWQRRIVRVQY